MTDLAVGFARQEALQLAVTLHASLDSGEGVSQAAAVDAAVLATAGAFTQWLLAAPAYLTLTVFPITYEQGNHALHRPTTRTGDDMAVTLTDTEEVSYAVEAEDSKGFPVADTLTWSESSDGAVVALTASADGTSAEFVAVAPGTSTITVTDGTLTASDVITVTAGAVASLVLTPGAVEQQAPPAPTAD